MTLKGEKRKEYDKKRYAEKKKAQEKEDLDFARRLRKGGAIRKDYDDFVEVSNVPFDEFQDDIEKSRCLQRIYSMLNLDHSFQSKDYNKKGELRNKSLKELKEIIKKLEETNLF
jgi:hypothetical protein